MRILGENTKRSYGLPGLEDENKNLFQKSQNKNSTKQNRITKDLREIYIESEEMGVRMQLRDRVCVQQKAPGSILSPEKKKKREQKFDHNKTIAK